ncbi:tRNA (adenosine(37)-N6)-threonylcarbamoyltransferase complex dimerization subunit type 1 TsaB [Rummeliibacillus stabekisii]|uniref:tRNA (adenosine(37)-N6)-threonylcarbamoyltransferase complex dimerization subunit type 1 TsaB n=1 Tax=Rummeliibacillus stabekisii TaxID=241244 RepID=UPI001167C5C8|nr:tRNA (adenosine(37)-N6)-threonylcarbamoyltransferase complex dimerization subunit type 1 TsaB [Rummeliibacillus stabekisii]MBB5171656.1 tRNA threonylcarbamoyladenosine biosynthesis protein TsaB [Rummeliibacillus stabekisii]GEL06263.1 tRNA (adenosine(37)-N6)-threonylcarbamoyltransferase complex dimerization subunit type 1 TsaB [Rummeliibacillus stabekisii]
MIWLGIDTANSPLAVAIVKDGKIVAAETRNMKVNHSASVMPAIEDIIKKAGLSPSDIDAIAVSQGPGSYTGVRIGVTVAKTLAWTLQIPLAGVSSLKVLAANAGIYQGLVCSVIDARRENVYGGVYNSAHQLESVIDDGHYSMASLLEKLKEIGQPVLFVGQDVDVFWQQIKQQLGELATRAPYTFDLPSAGQLIYLAEQVELPAVEDTHNFVPTYCRLVEAEANWLKEQKEQKR